MEQHLATVRDSIEFRDVVMAADRDGLDVYVRPHGCTAPTYRIVSRQTDLFKKITLDDLFQRVWAPVYMEDFAIALMEAGSDSSKVDLFAL